jgi:hypothetical protein
MFITIAGAGIGGLTAALSLHAAGLECRVLEAVRHPKPLGAGINLLPHPEVRQPRAGREGIVGSSRFPPPNAQVQLPGPRQMSYGSRKPMSRAGSAAAAGYES